MRFNPNPATAALTLIMLASLASAQNPVSQPSLSEKEAAERQALARKEDNASEPERRSVWIHLVEGRRIPVDDVVQTSDGVWYTLKNVTTFLDRARVARVERITETSKSKPGAPAVTGRWKISDSARVENFFLSKFGRPLPLTAFGQSDLHTRWGLNHSNGMDVGLHPDSVEGKALIRFLIEEEIPFLTFRRSVPGVSSGPHIHIGRSSPRTR